MNRMIYKYALFISMTMLFMSFNPPNGWLMVSRPMGNYKMAVEKGAGPEGSNAATIKSINETVDCTAWFFQYCLPNQFVGKRVRMSGFVKTQDVSDWEGLFFRVDGRDSNWSRCDDLHRGARRRPITGTTNWKKCEIVLDVPSNATSLAYGTALVGSGQIWFDNISFEVADESVPTTGKDSLENTTFMEPVNLTFEETEPDSNER